MTVNKVGPASAMDERVDLGAKTAEKRRQAAATLEQPDGTALIAQKVTKKFGAGATQGRAVRAPMRLLSGSSARAIDDRVDLGVKRAENHRRAGAEVHRPDNAAPASRTLTKELAEASINRAVRAPMSSGTEKGGE
jgi:hypothetical protein